MAPARPLTRVDGVAALVLFAAVLIAGSVRMVPGVTGAFHDDGVYALTAKALATGEGYRLIQLRDAPPQTKYPILYPALLSLFWRDGGTVAASVAAMQIATLALAAAALALFYLHAVRFGRASRSAAFAGGILCASAPNFLYYATSTLSELPFAFALAVTCWAVDAELRRADASIAREFAVGAVAALPFLIRSAGVVVPPLALVALLLHGRRLRKVAAGATLTALPWIAWMVFAGGGGASDATTSYQTDYLAWWRSTLELLGPGYVLVNVGKALAAIPHISIEAVARELYARVDAAALVVRAIGLIPCVWLLARLRRGDFLALLALGYLAFIVTWPWAPDRFVVPLLPVLLIAAFAALERGISLVANAAVARAGVLTLAGVLCLANGALLARYGEVSRTSEYPYFRLPDEPLTWESFREAFAWLRTNSDASDVVVAGFDTMTALYAERRAVRPFVPRPEGLFYGADIPLAGSVDELESLIDAYGARYLFLSPMPAFPEEAPLYELVADYARRRADRVTPVYVGKDARFVVYSLVKE